MSLLLPTVLALLAGEIVLNVDHVPPLRRSIARYQLMGIVPWTVDEASFGDERFVIDCAEVGESRCGELRQLAEPDGKIDLRRARDLWSRLYLTTRAERDELAAVPDTLAEFRMLHAYETWPREVVQLSAVKRAKRTIYRGQTADGRALSVSATEGADGGVRETEVALAAKNGRGDFHFYVYDAGGSLARQSEFPAGMRAAPEVCVACHTDSESGRVARFIFQP